MFRLVRDVTRVDYDSFESLQDFTCSGLTETVTLSVEFLKLSLEMEGERGVFSCPFLRTMSLTRSTAKLLGHLATSVEKICDDTPKSDCLSVRAVQNVPQLTEKSFQLLREVVVSFLALASATHRSGNQAFRFRLL